MTTSRKHGDSERGALILSYVIVVPIFLAALMFVVQGALWYLASEAALAAARQGVDAARVLHAPAGAGTSAALSFARSAASGYLLAPQATAAGSSPRTALMTVSGKVPELVPGLKIHVSEQAQAPMEKFTTP
jgi:Flp pilus assembly protein TadG